MDIFAFKGVGESQKIELAYFLQLYVRTIRCYMKGNLNGYFSSQRRDHIKCAPYVGREFPWSPSKEKGHRVV